VVATTEEDFPAGKLKLFCEDFPEHKDIGKSHLKKHLLKNYGI
jgi:hypothetical protein